MLKKKDNEITQRYLSLKENNYIASFKELSVAKNNIIKIEAQFKEKIIQYDEQNQKLQTITRKYNTNPIIPYITMEKSHFEKNIPNHSCICYICGEQCSLSNKENNSIEVKNSSEDFNQAGSTVPIQQASVTSVKDDVGNQNDINKASSTLNCNNQVSENDNSLIFELEYLRKNKEELLEIIEKQKLELKVSEERFIKSKPFQLLMSQAESMMQQLDHLKELNLTLIKQKLEIEFSKDNEIKIIEASLLEKKSEAEKKYLEVLKLYEEAKINLNNLSLKVENLENSLKAKENVDLNAMFDAQEVEKQKLVKQIETLKKEKKDLIKKSDDENERADTNEKLVVKLNTEIDRLKQNLKEEGIDPNSKQAIQKFDVREREEMKLSIKV